MGYDHAHGGGHEHQHAPANFGRAFAIGITLNLGFVIVEAIYGVLSHSMALVADADRHLGDVLGLAWVATSVISGSVKFPGAARALSAPAAAHRASVRHGTARSRCPPGFGAAVRASARP
jgi:cobalt-zinc-cadmium efflux system protein